jgi:topoisomerase (DNA) II binding protein 1
VATIKGKTTADWLAELELGKVKKAGSFLDGCKVYLSGFTDPEQVQLTRVLNYSGGVRLTQLVESVTHCVHSVVTNKVATETNRLLEQLDLSPHIGVCRSCI